MTALSSKLSVAVLALLTLVVPVLVPIQTYSAPGLNNRSVAIGSSQVSELTSYTFTFDVGSAAVLGSIQFEFCSNNPIPFRVCTPPSGFDVSAASIGSQSGEVGFSVDPGATANNILLTRIPAAATPQVVSYRLNNVQNPDVIGSYYVRVITYSTADGTGSSVEDAGLAFAITDTFSVTAYVPPFLIFCVGISITGNNCATATGSLIDFGILSESSASVGASQFAGATNGVGGLVIAVTGTTMTSGVNFIPAMATRAASNPGTGQFGMNLRANTNPAGGSNISGPGTSVAQGDYAVVNEFVFRDGDIIAVSLLSTDFDTATVSYLVNVPSSQPAGVYTTTLTYIATATF